MEPEAPTNPPDAESSQHKGKDTEPTKEPAVPATSASEPEASGSIQTPTANSEARLSEIESPSLDKPPGSGDIVGQKAEVNTTYNYFPASSAAGAQRFPDPTEILAATVESNPRFRGLLELAPRYAELLAENGTLIVSCAHPAAIETAGLGAAYAEQFIGYGKRRLILDDDESCNLRALLKQGHIGCIGESSEGRKDGGVNTVVVVNAYRPAAISQLEQALHRATNPHWLLRKLYFIILVSGSALAECDVHRLAERLPHWHIDALHQILVEENDTVEDAAVLETDLLASRRAGRWPPDEAEFLRDVEQVLDRGGLEALHEQIATRNSADARQLAPAKATALLQQANIVQKAVLLIAAYFPESTVRQFTFLVDLLIEGETVEITETEETSSSPDGKILSRSVRRSIPAAQYWAREEESLMSRLGLAYVPGVENAQVVSFSEPLLKVAIRKALFPPYVLRRFQRLHEKGVLLNPRTPKQVVNALVEMTSDMALQYPDAYDERWLMDLLTETMGRIVGYAAEAGVVLESTSRDNDLKDLFHSIDNDWRWYHTQLLSRFSTLCRGLLAHEQTGRVAHGFLDRLIAATQPDGAAAIEIIGSLRSAPGFDHFRKFRHLIEVGNVDTCRAIMNVLLEEMQDSPDAYWSVLKKVQEWHPSEQVAKGHHLTASQRWSLAFLYVVHEDFRQKSEAQHHEDGGPVALPLFLEAPGLLVLEERLDLLAAWLGHLHFIESLNSVLKRTNADNYNAMTILLSGRAEVAEFCLVEMLDLWNRPAETEAVEALVERLRIRLSRNCLEHCRILLRQRADWLRVDISNARDRDARTALIGRRKRAYELIRKLIPPKERT